MTDQVTRTYVAMGSNSDPHTNIRRGLDLLEEQFGTLTVSPVYRNRAAGFEGDDFLNLVVAFDARRDAANVAQQLHTIENQCGRNRKLPKVGPRALDLDLLLFGDENIDLGERHIPRLEILKFAFVLGPLNDIAGELRHPETGRTIAEHWAEFDQSRHPLIRTALSANTDKK